MHLPYAVWPAQSGLVTAVLDAPPPVGYRTGEAGYRRVTAALFAAGLATFMLLYNTQALLPEIAATFHVSAAQSTLTLSLTTVGLGVALLVAGTASEVLGRTRLILLSLVASGLITFACAVAPGWPALLTLRLLLGITLAGLPAVATAYLREELHTDTQARAAGLYIGGTALGGMTGRLVTGLVADVADWRWALAATAAIGLVCAAVVRLTLPPSRNFVAAPAHLRHLVTLARGPLTDRALIAMSAIGACTMGAFVAVYNVTGFRLTAAPFGLSVGAAGLVFLAYPVGAVASTVAGRLVDRYGRRTVAPIGCLVAIAGALVTLPDSLPVVVLGLAVLAVGFFTVHGVVSGWVPARAYAGGVAAGQAAASYLFCYYLGASVFGSLAGHAWTAGGWPAVVALAVVLLVVAGLLAAWLRRTRPLDPARDRSTTVTVKGSRNR
ncbi:MFS transporter [Micromonospora pallida]|nr:MFS transporter [Micromonospora pallida]